MMQRRLGRALAAFVLLAALAAGCDSIADASPTSTPTRQPAVTPGADIPTATASVSTPAHTQEPPSTPTPDAPDGISCAPPYPAPPYTVVTVFCANPAGMERARMVRVVDGDTIRVEIDGREEVIRFYGVDTPERGQRCFAEAAARVADLAGDAVLIVPDARDRDRFDRLLRYVYTTDGLLIDAVLIAEGYGLAWTRDGALRDPLIQLETVAQGRRDGCLWR